MKRPENNKWLNDALSETIGSEKPRTDFKAWKQKHPQAVEMLTSRTSRSSQEVLRETERSQTMSVRKRSWKYAATVALVCTGVVAAAVVGVKIRKYRYFDKVADGGYRVLSEDGRNMINFDENLLDGPEQAVEYAEEIDLLKQQGKRELVGVGETEVNGQHDSRNLSYEYNLSDGRTLKVGERDPDDKGPRTLVVEQRKEVISLLRADEYEELDIKEKEVRGRMFSFKRLRFVLSDGTEVIKSVGRPK